MDAFASTNNRSNAINLLLYMQDLQGSFQMLNIIIE